MRLLAAAAVAAALGLAAASPALADTLKVPSELYPDIQTAVTAAADGDTVLVAPGTYNEIVMVMDKTNLVIRGRARPVLNGPGFAFTVTGDLIGPLRVETSEDLITWTVLTLPQPVAALPAVLRDDRPVNAKQRYYRVVVSP